MINKTNILMLTSDPFILDRRIYQQASSLARDGFKVTIAYCMPNLILPACTDENIDFFNVPLVGVSPTKARWWDFWLKVRELGSSSKVGIRIYQYLIATFTDTSSRWNKKLMTYQWPTADLIVCHDIPLLQTAINLKKITGARKVLLDAHEIFDAQYDAIFSKTALDYWSRVCRQFKHQADAITTVTEKIADEIQNKFELPTKPIAVQNSYPYVDLNSIKKFSIHDLYNISPDKKIVLCMGEIRPGRNLAELINAMRYVEDSNIVLVFLGVISNAYLKKITSFIDKNNISNVYIGKAVKPEHVVNYACTADCGVISNRGKGPNNYLGGPNRLYEYIQARIPVLSYEHAGVKEVVDKFNTGIVCKWQNGRELAKLYNDTILLKQERKIKLERAASFYCWENDYVYYKEIIDLLLV